MLRRARRRVLLAGHTKCDGAGYYAYGTLRDFNLWITTPGVAPELLQTFRAVVDIKEAVE